MLYAQLNTSSKPESVISPSIKQKKLRHRRTGSGSPRTSCSSRTSIIRSACMVDTETQTETINLSEMDAALHVCLAARQLSHSIPYPQRVIVKEMKTNSSDDELLNGNCVQLHYLEREPGNYNRAISCYYVFKILVF